MVDLNKIARLLDARRPGHALPQGLYNDPDAYDFDLETIFARTWLLIGFEAELARPGSWMATAVGPWPILITRDRAGELHAFHNSCRHRGAQVCPTGKGAAARLVCPYHRWTYELSGELAQATRMPRDFRRSDHGLSPIHVRSVGGLLFVCLADDPPSIEALSSAYGPLIAPHRLADGRLAHESVIHEAANWKLAMENARECYHCATSHPELAQSFPVGASAHFDYGEDRRQEAFERRMAAAGLAIGPVEGDWWQAIRFTLNERFVSMTMDGAHAARPLMVEAESGDIGSLRLAIEPHAFVHATADQAFLFSVMPAGPRQTVVTSKWLVHADAVEGVDYDLESLTALWSRTNLQDRDLVENNQRGVDSRGYRPGPYSPDAETLTLRFVDWYCGAARGYIDGQAAGGRRFASVR
jgi:Rieske 2Fe-2S family protein